jgi:hypothetical protein
MQTHASTSGENWGIAFLFLLEYTPVVENMPSLGKKTYCKEKYQVIRSNSHVQLSL